ncbi:MAG TPA: hypothetical protein VLZ03_12975 [Thermodesulfobacteriota bacterium]|nr:hypothetical protein [Thermodesulfobacteriota bacterium]
MKGRRSFNTILLAASLWIAASGVSTAATATKSLAINAKVGKWAKVIVDTHTITFPNTDPNETKPVPAIQKDIRVIIKVRTGTASSVNLNLIADGDLVSGSDIIPIQNVTWEAFGQGFMSGALSKSTVQTAGSWKGSGVREGVFRYYLNDGWNYSVGEYQVTVTYTLTTP